jgi:sugar phosphate isomerase/epimerase
VKRRTFIQTTAGLSVTALAAQLARPLLAMPQQSKYLDQIGLQLWTVRKQMEQDVPKTLKAVAEAGYKQVELMDVSSGVEIAQQAKAVGLDVKSGFINWQSVCKPDEKGVPSIDDIIATGKEIGLEHLVFGYIGKGSRETVDQMKSNAKNANELGKKAADAGLQVCYHNHSFEFEKIDGDTTGFDVLMEEFDNDLVKFELDVFWTKVGGWDPMETMKKLDGRITQVHLKDPKEGTGVIYDEGKVPAEAFQECGDGTIDMGEVMKLAGEIGAIYCHVEQDQSPDPIASIGQSIEHLKSLS